MNLPEGVTGLEPEVAGYDERERLTTEYCESRDETGSVCGFEGDVTATETLSYSTVTMHWTCPVCGAEHHDVYDVQEVGL
jgi:rubredoxin